jgi:hypothetical protein
LVFCVIFLVSDFVFYEHIFMKTHTNVRVLYLIVSFSILSCLTKAETVRQWDIYSISFKSARNSTNPYKEIPVTRGGDLLTVTFQGTGGDALHKSITLVGFWDGASEWLVNFTPPFTGTWKYISLSADKGMNGKKGTLEVIPWSEEEKNANPVRHGLVRVKKDGDNSGHYFEYTDGKPFLWIGDTWWNWTNRKIKPETFRQLVDDRASKGFNIGQLFVAANGWSRESSLLDETYSILDTEHMKKVEDMIRYANSKGITVWIHGWWSRPNLNTLIGAEKMQRWWRYLVHRFGAYNVIWVVAGEYNMNNNAGFPLSFWKEMGKLIKNEDPYERIVSLHNTPPFWDGGAEAPQWATGSVLHQESWLDYNQSQVGHGKYANEMIPYVITEEYNRKPSKPIVITEPWYEFIEGSAAGMDVRFAAWSAVLSGAAGHTYGGGHVWLASVPEAPGGAGSWPYEKGFERNTYDYEGAVSMKHLASFFKNIKWWNLAPHTELVKEYPQPFCLAKPGEEYVVYLRYGGTAKIVMEAKEATNNYRYNWYNPSTGKTYDTRSIQGKNLLQFNCPDGYPSVPEYKDWVLYICRE